MLKKKKLRKNPKNKQRKNRKNCRNQTAKLLIKKIKKSDFKWASELW